MDKIKDIIKQFTEEASTDNIKTYNQEDIYRIFEDLQFAYKTIFEQENTEQYKNDIDYIQNLGRELLEINQYKFYSSILISHISQNELNQRQEPLLIQDIHPDKNKELTTQEKEKIIQQAIETARPKDPIGNFLSQKDNEHSNITIKTIHKEIEKRINGETPYIYYGIEREAYLSPIDENITLKLVDDPTYSNLFFYNMLEHLIQKNKILIKINRSNIENDKKVFFYLFDEYQRKNQSKIMEDYDNPFDFLGTLLNKYQFIHHHSPKETPNILLLKQTIEDIINILDFEEHKDEINNLFSEGQYHPDFISLFLNKGVDINTHFISSPHKILGNNALGNAIINNDKLLFDALLEQGADIDAQQHVNLPNYVEKEIEDKNHKHYYYNVLTLAIQKNPSFIPHIIKAGVDINKKTQDYKLRPAQLLLQNNKIDSETKIKFLTVLGEAGAKIHHSDKALCQNEKERKIIEDFATHKLIDRIVKIKNKLKNSKNHNP